MTVGSCVVSENVAYTGLLIGNFSSTTVADCAAKCQDYSSGFPSSEMICLAHLAYSCALSHELPPKLGAAATSCDILGVLADSGNPGVPAMIQACRCFS